MERLSNSNYKLKVGIAMNKTLKWKLLLLIGLCPFAAPFIYNMVMHWELLDMLVLWSYVYWPTYIIGLFLIGLSIFKLKK